MHWIFLCLAAVALAFVLLGALSVWAAILLLALKAMLVVAVAASVYFIWKRLFGRKA